MLDEMYRKRAIESKQFDLSTGLHLNPNLHRQNFVEQINQPTDRKLKMFFEDSID